MTIGGYLPRFADLVKYPETAFVVHQEPAAAQPRRPFNVLYCPYDLLLSAQAVAHTHTFFRMHRGGSVGGCARSYGKDQIRFPLVRQLHHLGDLGVRQPHDSLRLGDAVEIQPDASARAERTMRLNGLESKIKIFNRDLKEIRSFLPHASYDLVICNPPYSPSAASLPSPKAALRTARQESECTLNDIAAAAAWLLRDRARFCLMLPAPRLTEAFETLKSYRLEPKRLRLVHANASRPARLALIEAMLAVHPGLIIEPPLIVKTSNGEDTDEIRRIYHLPV